MSSQQERVEELEQVHVEQTERQAGQQNRRFLAVFAGVVDQLLAEQPFLENRAYESPENTTFQMFVCMARSATRFVASPSESASDSMLPTTLPTHIIGRHMSSSLKNNARFHVEFAGFDDGRFAHEHHRDRHGDQVQRHARTHDTSPNSAYSPLCTARGRAHRAFQQRGRPRTRRPPSDTGSRRYARSRVAPASSHSKNGLRLAIGGCGY